ncbi:MAG: family 16 glycoside hydrolase [Planctomycetota bacterium]
MARSPLHRLLPSAVAALASTVALHAQDRIDFERIPVLLIGGQNNHDCEWTTPELKRSLEETGRFEVTITTEPGKTLADAKGIEKYAAFVLDYNGARWGEEAETNFTAAVKAGKGVTIIHAANNAFPGWKEYEEIVGLLWRDGTGHGRFHPFDVHIVDVEHPITHGMADITGHPDELYHRLVNTQGVPVRVLGVAHSDPATGGTGNDEPMIIVGSYGKGRVFHTPLGHVWRNAPDTHVSHQDPQFRRLVARGTEWAATGACTLDPTPPNWLSPQEKALGFRLLFDGQGHDGWRGYRAEGFPAKGWAVEKGALHSLAGGEGGDIVNHAPLGDFELRFQWAVTKRANSGVIYRATEADKASYMTGPEYQVLDDEGQDPRPSANTSAAALYALADPESKTLQPVGVYNDGRIVVRGWHVEHWLAGKKVVDVDLSTDEMKQRIAASKFAAWSGFAKSDRGLLVLQDHGDEVWYRSIRVRDLTEDKEKKGGDGR